MLHAGYDMEDAMILNKSAVDRGLAHGTIFKTETVNLKDDKGKTQVVLQPQSTTSLLCL